MSLFVVVNRCAELSRSAITEASRVRLPARRLLQGDDGGGWSRWEDGSTKEEAGRQNAVAIVIEEPRIGVLIAF